LTRNTESPKAKALAEANKGVIEFVQGDSTDPEPIFEGQPKGSISSLFIATVPGKVPEAEEKQAIPLIDAAVEHGVQHIVFSSVDRGGDEKSWTNPTAIKHFYEKHNIELYLRDKAQKEDDKFTWTILRPVAFLDNWSPGFPAAAFSAMLDATLKSTQKIQLVSVRDIGLFAAAALTDPTKWAGRAIGLAGDEITLAEAQTKFKEVTGKPLPKTFTFLGRLMLWLLKEVGLMFTFLAEEGYHADIQARRSELPTQDFETWLRDSSKWVDQK
jgi:uncharacterized protein YbjT (DUF2867 family)